MIRSSSGSQQPVTDGPMAAYRPTMAAGRRTDTRPAERVGWREALGVPRPTSKRGCQRPTGSSGRCASQDRTDRRGGIGRVRHRHVAARPGGRSRSRAQGTHGSSPLVQSLATKRRRPGLGRRRSARSRGPGRSRRTATLRGPPGQGSPTPSVPPTTGPAPTSACSPAWPSAWSCASSTSPARRPASTCPR